MNDNYKIQFGMDPRERLLVNEDKDLERDSLEWIMKQPIFEIFEVPAKDQIYDNISFKLSAFYKRFWENKQEGLKQNTRKAGEILLMVEKMKMAKRDENRDMKVCAYAREVKKFQPVEYQRWKNYIWMDLLFTEQTKMIEYVEMVTPPIKGENQTKEAYSKRSKENMNLAYRKMTDGMLMIEVFNKIWTIRKDKKDGKLEDVERYKAKTHEMLVQIQKVASGIKDYFQKRFGEDEWKEIENLW